MKILVINGPDMNTASKREIVRSINERLLEEAKSLGIICEFFEANGEGDMVTLIQSAWNSAEGIILNAGDYAHYSVAIRDAIASVKKTMVVEVHPANVHASEEFRRASMLSPVCKGVITGLGEECYFLALRALASEFNAASRQPARAQTAFKSVPGGKHTA